MKSGLLFKRISTSSDIRGDGVKTMRDRRRGSHVCSNWMLRSVLLLLLVVDDVDNNTVAEENDAAYAIQLEATERDYLVTVSPNVVAEDLHNTRSLDTTYYVTNSAQAFDFFYPRQSGLLVNIGVLNVNLSPEYEDMDEMSDNSYMEKNPNSNEETIKFKEIIQKFCRHPIPDQYTITLEIARDRTTKAKNIICDSRNPTVPRCPPGYETGDKYLHRYLNEPCIQMDTYPETLSSVANSILCTEQTPLFHQLFKQPHTDRQRPITFPSSRCRQAISKCEQCLNKQQCALPDPLERRCCQLECYDLHDCKLANSQECRNASVECAHGDAYRFTIQPNFMNLQTEARCHIRNRRRLAAGKQTVYELFFFLQAPHSSFQTPVVHEKVEADRPGFLVRGDHSSGYLTVHHDAGLELDEEMILTKEDWQNGSAYFLEKMVGGGVGEEGDRSSDGRGSRGDVVVHKISQYVHAASVGFDRPFEFSSSSWGLENDCHTKNVNKMKAPRRVGRKDDSDRVDVLIDSTQEPIKYYLKSLKKAPFIRFTVPANTSILPYYFASDDGPTLIDSEEFLSSNLALINESQTWEITLSGKMSKCPGYISAIVTDESDGLEMFRYDFLVLCPDRFRIVFTAPNFHDSRNSTFRLRLTDSQRSRTISLTHVILKTDEGNFHDRHAPQPRQPHRSSINFSSSNSRSINFSPRFLYITAIISLVLASCSVIAYGLIFYRQRKLQRRIGLSARSFSNGSLNSMNHKFSSGATAVVLSNCNNANKHESESKHRSKNFSNRRIRLTLTVYVVCLSVYGLALTFTGIISVLASMIEPDVDRLDALFRFPSGIDTAVRNQSDTVNRFRKEMTSVTRHRAMSAMRNCNIHVADTCDVISDYIDRVIIDQVSGSENTAYRTRISNLFNSKAYRYSVLVDRYLSEYRLVIQSVINRFSSSYRKRLDPILQSGWLAFPMWLFNQTTRTESSLPASSDPSYLHELKRDAGFFFDIHEPPDVQLWFAQFWERFAKSAPTLPRITGSRWQHSCTGRDDSRRSTRTGNRNRKPPDHHLDSNRFFTSVSRFEKLIIAECATAETNPDFPMGSKAPRGFGGSSPTSPSRSASKPPAGSPSSPTFRTSSGLSDDMAKIRDDVSFIRVIFFFVDVFVTFYRICYVIRRCGSFNQSPSPKLPGRHPHSCQSIPECYSFNHDDVTDLQKTVLSSSDINRPSTNSCSSSNNISSSNGCSVTGRDVRNARQTTNSMTADGSPEIDQFKNTGPASFPCCIGSHPVHRSTIKTKCNQSDNPEINMTLAVTRDTIKTLLQCRGLSRLLFGAVILLAVCLTTKHVVSIPDTDLVGVLWIFTSGLEFLRLKINHTNVLLLDEAISFNNKTFIEKEDSVKQELRNLENFVEYLKSEQKKIALEFLSDGELSSAERRDVDQRGSPPGSSHSFDRHLMPCHFQQLTSEIFTDFKLDTFRSELFKLIQPDIASIKRLFLTSSHVIAFVLATVFAVNLLSLLLFYHLTLADEQKKLIVRQRWISSLRSFQSISKETSSNYIHDSTWDRRSAPPAPVSVRCCGSALGAALQANELRAIEFNYSETKV